MGRCEFFFTRKRGMKERKERERERKRRVRKEDRKR